MLAAFLPITMFVALIDETGNVVRDVRVSQVVVTQDSVFSSFLPSSSYRKCTESVRMWRLTVFAILGI